MTLLVGILCPATGALLITHRRLLQANLISHAVVPGIVLGLSLGIDPALGGVLSGLIGSIFAEKLSLKRNEENEAIINTVLAGTLGLGVLLIPLLEIRVDLESILFGDLLAVGSADIIRTLIAAIAFLFLLGTSYQKLVYIGLDPDGATASGLGVSSLRLSVGFVTALVLVSSMAAVGVVLVIGLLSAPALFGLYNASSLHSAMLRSAGYGILLSFIGFSFAIIFNLSPGPLIGCICLISLFLKGKLLK
tara:strand:+ start:10265 stop:11011 length:747 start_codon:yes stop_codon:yes gene_type:complete